MDDFEPPFESYSTTFPIASISSKRRSSVVAGASQHVAIRSTSTTSLQDDLISFLSYAKTESIPILPVTKPDIRTGLGHGASFLVNGAVLPETYVDPATGTIFPEGMAVALKRADPNSNTVVGRLPVIFNELITMHHPPLRAHPNIVKLLGIGFEIEGPPESLSAIPVLIPEIAELGNLAEVLETARKQDRPLEFQDKMSLCLDIAHGLEILHRCDIVHGDVKCENILIFENEQVRPKGAQTKGGVVRGFNLSCKLTDFGVLRHPESETGVLLGGSLPWQAPECSRGHFFEVEDAKRTDIYSFGMLLWRIFLDGDPFSHLEDSGLVSYSEGDTPKQRRTKRNDAVARLKEDDGLVKHVCDSLALAGKFARTQLEMLCEVICITLVKDASRRELSLARIIALLTEDQWFEPRHPVPPSRMPRQFNAKLLDVERWHSEFDKASPVVLEYLASGFKDYAEGRTKRVGNNTDEGQSAAAYQLAICYANGFGVPFNADECIKWLIFAAERGSHKAEDALTKICRATGAEKEMTIYTQRSDARAQLSSSWDSKLTADYTTRMAYVSGDSSISASATGLSPSAETSWTFLSAAENCRYDALRELLSQSTKPGISEDGVSPLHFLSMWDVSEAKELGQQLIQAGADVNCVAKRGNTVGGTPLMWSVYGNRLDHSDVLIKLGADPMVRTSDGDDALSFAARLHLTSQLRHLLDNLRPVQVRGHIGRLIEAAAGGESRFTRMARHQEHWKTAATETLSFLKQWHDLFDGSANFNDLLLSAIHASLKSDYGRMNADVQLEFIDRYRISASDLKGLLRESVLSHNIDLFNGLLDYGVRVQGKYDQGKTLLHLCARIPDHNLAATVFAPRLLDLGAEVDVCDEDGLTPWMDAILERKWDLADLLMRKDAKPLKTDKDGFNVLGLCIKAVNIGSLKYLLKYCAKKEAFHQDSFIVNQRNGISALQLVAELSMPRSHGWKCEVVGMFLLVLANYAREPWQLTYRSSGILPDASALDIAISTGNVHAVKNLVKKGAHRDPRDKARALDIATQKLRDRSSAEEDWLYRKNLERSVFIIENWDGEDQKRVRKTADDWTNVRTIDESHPASSWELVIWKYKDRAGVTVAS